VSDRKRISPRVDADLWQEFRDSVEERKGQTRGVLGDELENAIRQYLGKHESPALTRMDKRLNRIEQEIGAAPTDGGVDTLSDDEHTHAPLCGAWYGAGVMAHPDDGCLKPSNQLADQRIVVAALSPPVLGRSLTLPFRSFRSATCQQTSHTRHDCGFNPSRVRL